MVSEYGGDADGGVAAEVAMRFGRSGQPDSQQVVAVLKAVTDVIRAEGLPVSPTSYFAAIMSALEKPDTQASQQASGAFVAMNHDEAGFVAVRGVCLCPPARLVRHHPHGDC